MRLIDADALKAHYAWWGDFPEDGPNRSEEKKIFDTIVDLQPTVDACAVIRCKNCKWYGEPGCAIRIVDDTDKPSDMDFCSFAERKEGE